MQDAAQRIQNPEFRIQKMEVRVCFSYLLDSGYWLLTTGFENCGLRDLRCEIPFTIYDFYEFYDFCDFYDFNGFKDLNGLNELNRILPWKLTNPYWPSAT